MSLKRSIALVGAVVAVTSMAQAPAPKLVGKKTKGTPKVDLGLPKFDSAPNDVALEKPKDTPELTQTKTSVDETYAVVKVQHAKAFVHTPDGAKPAAPFEQVVISGNPLTSEKFSSAFRIKSPGKRGARIDVVVLDPRGDTVMEADGSLVFRTGDEAEWSVDWSPTSVRGPGEFKVLVRVGGNPLGTFPIKFAETPK